jgi:hypothetical protein
MGEITLSRRLGFLDKARDVNSIIQKVLDLFKYASWVRLTFSNFGILRKALYGSQSVVELQRT